MSVLKIVFNRILLVSFILALVFVPGNGMTHGTGFRVVTDAQPMVLSFYYTDSTPMAYAEINVFGPDNEQVAFQSGRTDTNGYFAFVPDRSGKWIVKVNDGRGHSVKAVVESKGPHNNPNKDVSCTANGKK